VNDPVTRAKSVPAAGPAKLYDCSRCPGYCCSIYPLVEVGRRDLARLAAHLGLDVEEVESRHTFVTEGMRVLRQKRDPVLGHACGFLDRKTRGCTVYEGRPEVCRDYPGRPRCAYYDVLEFERTAQDDPDVLPLFQIRFPEKGARR
jgi:uncharacterized protein